MHLVCKKLHQIANLHVNPKLSFHEDSPKDLASLVQSSRIFEELEFSEGCGDHLKSQEKFQPLSKYLGFTGPHIKTLSIDYLKVDPLIVQSLLNLLPNLESLELNFVESVGRGDQSFKWVLKSTKIERVKMIRCFGLERLLGSFNQCAIKELELKFWPEKRLEVLKKFLEAQEKNLKKLTIGDDLNLLGDLTELRLEHLNFRGFESSESPVSFAFLKHQVYLKHLSFHIPEHLEGDLSPICKLKELETLVLRGSVSDNSGLNNLYKLRKLKRLQVYPSVSRNILDHMKFGVFQNLEELDAEFEDVSVESIQEMSRITPNLKKIKAWYVSLDTKNALLDSLECLESVELWGWEMSEKVYPKIKHLRIRCGDDFNYSAEQFIEQFPNLEYLMIEDCRFEVTLSFFTKLLSGLKLLKTLYMDLWDKFEEDPEPILRCFQEHGKNLEDANIVYAPDLEDLDDDGFAIEKRSAGDSFRINKEDYSFCASWMWEMP